ncbi:MAG TPA: spore coat protein [Clostridia bacterium]|nr:spore coat protein [Clostridia bacterium]
MQQNTPMTEQEILTDLLTQEKQCVKDYAGNITEASCKNLRQLLLSNLTECSTDQLAVFEQMKSRNFYKTKDAPDNDVQTTKQEMQTLKQQTGI